MSDAVDPSVRYPRILLKLSGEALMADESYGIHTGTIRQIDIIKNQTFLHNRQRQPRDVNFTFVDNNPSPGESYYYVRVLQDDGQMAWSSPIWVRR